MIITTTDFIPNKEIEEVLGIAEEVQLEQKCR